MSRARDRRKAEAKGNLRQFGVTVALRKGLIDAAAEGGKDNLRAELKDLGEQALEGLKAYVGGAPLRSEPATSIQGPEDDPLQGPIYGLSVAALFDVEELGPDSPARLLVMTERDPNATAVDVVRSLEGEHL